MTGDLYSRVNQRKYAYTYATTALRIDRSLEPLAASLPVWGGTVYGGGVIVRSVLAGRIVTMPTRK